MKAFVQAALVVVIAIVLTSFTTASHAATASAVFCSGGKWVNHVCTCSSGKVAQPATKGSFACVQVTLSAPMPSASSTLVCKGGQLLTPKGCECPTGTIWNLKKAPPRCDKL